MGQRDHFRACADHKGKQATQIANGRCGASWDGRFPRPRRAEWPMYPLFRVSSYEPRFCVWHGSAGTNRPAADKRDTIANSALPGFSSDQPPRPITDNAKRGCGGSGGPLPAVAPQARKIMRGPTFYWHLTTKHKAACVLPYLIACAVYTRAHFTSTSRARFSSVPFAACVPWVRHHWRVPTKQRCDHGPPQARLSAVCACVLCSKKGAGFLHCTVLTRRMTHQRHAIYRGVVACRMKQPALL